ncbi:phospholipase D/nuclease [Ophiobolus disseminans]|uniref:Phospholipase D/nuclease n=1 Tax=Ophiobolus disseminans TaxID=1469910 RepID=A0A6A6ZVU6_9PLEO|nr:phospholipase D/nuclease [Ophiobolus disseminans]
MPPKISSTEISHFNEPFISALDSAAPINARDDPNYFSRYPRSLITTSNVDTFVTGSGSAIYDSLTPLLQSTNHELILVTCFWAHSSSLETLNHILRHLSDKAIHRGTDKIRVRLCFSSISIFQKLFHKQSVTGQTYQSDSWVKKLGLPDPRDLGGLDLNIKSVFILPFSVMHPKFIIVDRKKVVLPSCNISWEEWFEGAATIHGPVVEQFLKFYFQFWERRLEVPTAAWNVDQRANGEIESTPASTPLKSVTRLSASDVYTVFLPSPHRRNPRLSPFTPFEKVFAPPTPLNTFILSLFAKAERCVRIQTPNVTAPPVLSTLLAALARGVDVQILTSERLMILEQLVTAGTTTSRCIRTLIKRYQKLSRKTLTSSTYDEEAAISPRRIGRLHISYFEPIGGPKKRGSEGSEPQQSHLKMTIVDNEVLVLGSGNLDRASWFTSQELGVAFFDKDVVKKVASAVDEAMQGRSKVVFDSESRR